MLIFWRPDILGVGWGNIVLFDFYSSHATPLLDALLQFGTYVMLRCWMLSCTSTFSCTSTHTSCYTAGCALALPLGEFVKANCKEFFLGRNTDFGQTVGLVTKPDSPAVGTHKGCRQDFTKIWKSL